MVTFSINRKASDVAYINNVWATIVSLKKYFVYYNKINAEEAMQRAFIQAVSNRDERYKSLKPYIKKLARTVMRGKDKDRDLNTVPIIDDESGEETYAFSQKMHSEFDNSPILKDMVMNELQDIYLLMPEDFLKLSAMFTQDITKDSIIRNNELKKSIMKLTSEYGGALVCNCIAEVLNQVGEETKIEGVIKEIELKPINDFEKYDYRLDSKFEIRADSGEWGYIDLETYKTEPFDPDMKKWSIRTTCPIIKCDISPLINMMYDKLFTQKGLSNEFIKWAGERYRLTSPGGYSRINMDISLFMNIVHKELIANMLRVGMNKIVAVSSDSVYIKPTRGTMYKSIKVKMYNGKIMELPCEVYFRGGK